ncbi:GlxA family transcriptional regulator [Thetidibacter halocola]
MQDSQNAQGMRHMAVLLFPQFSNHCLANTIEPFRAANTIAGKSLYRWSFLTLTGGPVASSSGLTVETESWAKARPSGDFLFVMPSYGHRVWVTPALGQTLRAARRRFATLVGLDTGAWLLAAAGLLDRRRATIHWHELDAFAEAFPDVTVTDDRFVLEPDIATCGGAATAFDLTLELIRRHHSPIFALEVAALFMHGDAPGLRDPLRGKSPGAMVRRATALMRRRLEEPLPIAEIAAQMRISQRLMEQVFRRETGLTPNGVYRALRLREARRLVELSDLGIAEIAGRCGYQDAGAMTRAYRMEFGVAPSAHRQA